MHTRVAGRFAKVSFEPDEARRRRRLDHLAEVEALHPGVLSRQRFSPAGEKTLLKRLRQRRRHPK